jgi:galactokinase
MRALAVSEFARRFGGAPRLLARAPGRVNLIGEHTDYNQGFVLPIAIDQAVWIAARPLARAEIVVYSRELDTTATFSLDALSRREDGWAEYIKGIAWALGSDGSPPPGWEGVIVGDVPVGAGLASSAALELAVARVFAAFGDVPWDPRRMARLAQRAENEWVGMSCGIMDQLSSAMGRRRHALLIDCRSLDVQAVPMPAGATVVVLDTTTRRGLVGSAYNERRSQCDEAARLLGVAALRDVDARAFAERQAHLPPLIRARARHVVTENARVLRAAEALRTDDLQAFGRLMNESHASLRDDYAVSGPELDLMVGLAQAHGACFGARMTGGGFAGCAVALVRPENVEQFVANVRDAYAGASGLTPSLLVCEASDGASIE